MSEFWNLFYWMFGEKNDWDRKNWVEIVVSIAHCIAMNNNKSVLSAINVCTQSACRGQTTCNTGGGSTVTSEKKMNPPVAYQNGRGHMFQIGRHFPDDIFKWIILNENIWISINISLKFVPRVPINNIPTLVQVMAWRRPGDKPLSEPMMVRLPTHICVTRPQWVNCNL